MAGVLHLVATLTARLGREGALQAALAGMLGDVRAEAGCLRHDLRRDRDETARSVMLEAWTDAAAQEAHHRATPFTALAARFGDLLAAPPGLRRLEHLA